MPQNIATQQFLPENVAGLKTAFDTVINNNNEFLNIFTTSLSVLAVFFILLRTLQSVFENAQRLKEGKDAIFGLKEIITAVLLVFVIMFYRQLFAFSESVLVEISNAVAFSSSGSQEVLNQASASFVIQAGRQLAATSIESSTNLTFAGFNLAGLGQSAAALLAPNPYVYGFCAVSLLVAGFNYLLSYIVYMDRALLLMILNCLAPLIFALSIVKGMDNIVRKFFLIYICTFLILPFVLVGFQICDQFYINFSSINNITQTVISEAELEMEVSNQATNIKDVAVGGIAEASDILAKITNYDVFLRLPLLLIVVLVKIKIMSLITQTLWKIIS